MSVPSVSLIQLLSKIKTKNPFINTYSEGHSIFDYNRRAGRIILNQFNGFNNLEHKMVLDHGCGLGGKTTTMAEAGAAHVFGLDMRDRFQEAVQYSENQGLSISFLIFDGQRIPLGDQSMDVVISSNVLEHVMDLDLVTKDLFRVLRPGGVLLLRWHPYATRFGGHLQDVLAIPFIHRMLPDRVLIWLYRETLQAKYEPAMVKKYISESGINLNPDPPTLSGLKHINKISLNDARKSLKDAGFDLTENRYYRGKRFLSWARFLPLNVRSLFADYEILILHKPK